MPIPCTVSGNLQSLTSGQVANGLISFQLINIGTGNAIGISGTSLFPSLKYVVMSAPDGSFSVQVWGNDNITPPNTLYAVTFRDPFGNEVGPIQYNITGASVSLNALVPSGGSMVGPKSQIFTSNSTFVIPVGTLKATVVAAGGAGGGSSATLGGSGGGAGGMGVKWFSGLTPGSTLTVTVGIGGSGVSGGTGNSGGNSSVSSGSQTITSIVANGGAGGMLASALLGAGGAGGAIGTGADLNFGGNGGDSISASSTNSGNGAPGPFGGGGNSTGIPGAGAGGSAPGAGGSGGGGGSAAAGGAGASGTVIFEWIG
jgi:hypothetical protein